MRTDQTLALDGTKITSHCQALMKRLHTAVGPGAQSLSGLPMYSVYIETVSQPSSLLVLRLTEALVHLKVPSPAVSFAL